MSKEGEIKISTMLKVNPAKCDTMLLHTEIQGMIGISEMIFEAAVRSQIEVVKGYIMSELAAAYCANHSEDILPHINPEKIAEAVQARIASNMLGHKTQEGA